jgi:hypothetical protein
MLFNLSTFNLSSFSSIFDDLDFNTGVYYHLLLIDTNDYILHTIPFYWDTDSMYYVIENLFDEIYLTVGENLEYEDFYLEIM